VWTFRRNAARVVLLDPDDRVLLLEASDPADRSKGSWWEIPGGGIESGETSADAALRELYEETGIGDVDIGPCVWQQRAKYSFAGYHFDSLDHVHVARARRAQLGDYQPPGLEALEAMAFKGFRWWPVPELAELIAGGGRVIPPWLARELPDYLVAGDPSEPIYMGELGSIF
jgi:8-oxo-dGTP pyrophosphatase MutT (NUDIX family)